MLLQLKKYYIHLPLPYSMEENKKRRILDIEFLSFHRGLYSDPDLRARNRVLSGLEATRSFELPCQRRVSKARGSNMGSRLLYDKFYFLVNTDMAYLYAWYGNDDDLFYIGFSSGDSKTHTRARRMVGVCYTNRQLSRAEAYFYDRNKRQFQTTVRIIKEGLNDSEALLLESALIIKYKSILLNSNHLNLNMFDTKELPEDIFDLADSLLCKIRAGEITHTSKTIIWQKPKLLYIEYEDRYDIISTKSFFFQYGMSVRDFLKHHDPKHYKMKEIGIEYEDVILYYDKLRF